MNARSTGVRLGLILLSAVTLLSAVAPVAIAKEKVQSITDLPVRAYPVTAAPSVMIDDAAAMDALRTEVRTDIESILDKYEIEDVATLKRFFGVLSSIALFEGRNDDAEKYWEKVRSLEDKEAAKIMTGLNGSALVAAREAGEPGSDAYIIAFTEAYGQAVSDMPWEVVQDAIQGAKGRSEILSENLVRGLIESQMDGVVAETGELSDQMAERLVGMQSLLRDYLPMRKIQIATLQKKIDLNRVEKNDIWPARNIEFDADAGYENVVVGIWDSGVDPNVFGEQMWTNTAETHNGVDDDGNGFVDDFHGIAYDMFGNRHPEVLHPQGDQTGRVDEAMAFMKGMTDLQAAIDSKAATELKQYIGALQPSEVQNFITALGFSGLYAHGTHVAGIALAGNPFAEALCARISFDYHSKPAPILQSAADAHAASYSETVKYFQDANVRVVNMSWGWSFGEIESSLEANGIGASAEERKAMTEEIFGTLDKGLYAAMSSTPDILYCVAAGNDDNDVAFDRHIPSSYELPNVMVVGAVDQAGERTSFTSMGKNVVCYANGFEVMSYVPGGAEMAMSGTSMASPNAANLAAKVFTVDPSLTPTDVIALIEKGADELAGQGGLKIINPKATIALVEKARASK